MQSFFNAAFIEAALDYCEEVIAPTRCACCDSYGQLLCDDCLRKLNSYERMNACKLCGAALGAVSCTECFGQEFLFDDLLLMGNLEGGLARAIRNWKDRNEQRLGRVFGQRLGQVIRLFWGDWAEQIVFIPSTRSAYKKRGFSQSLALAQACAQSIGLKLDNPLIKHEAQDLRGLGRAEREKESKGLYSLKEDASILSRILIVDDVLTTGSTLNAVCSLLKNAGAEEVRVALIARTIKQN